MKAVKTQVVENRCVFPNFFSNLFSQFINLLFIKVVFTNGQVEHNSGIIRPFV